MHSRTHRQRRMHSGYFGNTVGFLSRTRMGPGVLRLARSKQLWIALLVSLALAQVAASLLMPRGSLLTNVSDVVQTALLLVGTAAFLLKTIRSRPGPYHSFLFWLLMTAGMALWLAYEAMWFYFEVIQRQDVPNPFLGDVVLFLHLVPMIAALAVVPHLRIEERDERIRMLDFTLLLTWWVFIYVYVVIPWQTVAIDEATYSTEFNYAYLTEKLVLLIGLAVLAYASRGGWRQLYGQLLGAGALYASSSYVANWAIGHKTYYSGCIYDIPLTLSMAWVAAVPAMVRDLSRSDSKQSKPLFGVWITRLSAVALFSLSWMALHAALDPTLPSRVRAFRIDASLVAMAVMGIMVFWRQRLLGAELSYFLEESHRSFDELKALQDQLIQSEKLASLGQLVGGAAHEINNPLTAMLGYSDLLCTSSLPPPERQQAIKIAEEARRTRTLVASLLTFARQTPVKLIPIDLNSVLQTSVRLLAPQLETHGVAVRLDLGSSLPQVLADSNQLLHVSLHLGGQVGSQLSQLNGESHAALLIRTRYEDKTVKVDFLADTPFSQSPSFQSLLAPNGVNKPATLSLNACCRIVQEHGGRLLQPSIKEIPAFRMELPASVKSAIGQPSRAAAHSAL